MIDLESALYFLDTTAVVSAPSITREQAAELAALLREYNEENSQLCDEYNARGRELMNVHDALHRECDGKADLPEEIRALRKERDELKMKLVELEEEFADVRFRYDELLSDTETQIEAPTNNKCPDCRNGHCLCGRCDTPCPCDTCQGHGVILPEATGDLDPGVYEGSGKGFGK